MNPLVLFAFVGLASAALIPVQETREGGFIGYQIPFKGVGLESLFLQKEGTNYPLNSGFFSGERGIVGNEGIIGVVGKPVGVQTEGIQGVKEVRGLFLAPQYTETPILKTEIPVTVEKVAKPIMTEQALTEIPVVQLYKPVQDLGVVGNVESQVFRQIPVGQKYYGQQIHRAFPYLFNEELYGERPYVYGQEYPYYRKHEMSSYVYPYGQEHKQLYPHEMYRNEYPLAYDNVAYPFRSGYEYPIYGKQYHDKSYVHGYPYYAKELQYQPEHVYQRHEVPFTYEPISYPFRSGYQYVQPESHIYRRHVPLAYEHISHPLRSGYQYVL